MSICGSHNAQRGLQDALAAGKDAQHKAESVQSALAVDRPIQSTADAEQQIARQEMPCSAAQLRILAQAPRMPGPHVFVFRLNGSLDQGMLQKAINQVVRDHDALRTHIMQPGAARPQQQIRAASEDVALEAIVIKNPGRSNGADDTDVAEECSMSDWIEEALTSLHQLAIPVDKAPLAAVNIYEVSPC